MRWGGHSDAIYLYFEPLTFQFGLEMNEQWHFVSKTWWLVEGLTSPISAGLNGDESVLARILCGAARERPSHQFKHLMSRIEQKMSE